MSRVKKIPLGNSQRESLAYYRNLSPEESWRIFLALQKEVARIMGCLVNLNPKNARALLKTLRDFGFKDPDLSEKDLQEEGYIVQLGYPPWRIDLHLGSEIPFEELWKRHRIFHWDELEVRVVDLEDLKRLKRLSGRTKDLADLECLERVHETD